MSAEPKNAIDVLSRVAANMHKKRNGIVESKPTPPLWEIDKVSAARLVGLFAKVREQNDYISSAHFREAEACRRQGELFIKIKSIVPAGYWLQFIKQVLSPAVGLAGRTIRERMKFAELWPTLKIPKDKIVVGYHDACVAMGIHKPTTLTAKMNHELTDSSEDEPPPPPPVVPEKLNLGHIKEALKDVPVKMDPPKSIEVHIAGRCMPISPAILRNLADELERGELVITSGPVDHV